MEYTAINRTDDNRFLNSIISDSKEINIALVHKIKLIKRDFLRSSRLEIKQRELYKLKTNYKWMRKITKQ